MHQIKFQSLIRGIMCIKMFGVHIKGKTLIAEPDNRDEAQENDKYAVGIYKKKMMHQKNWLAMHRLSFQAYCIIFFKQVLKIVSTLK